MYFLINFMLKGSPIHLMIQLFLSFKRQVDIASNIVHPDYLEKPWNLERGKKFMINILSVMEK